MNENVGAQLGRMMGEAMAMEEDFDLWNLGYTHEHARQHFPGGVDAYDRIAKRRELERLEQGGVVNRTIVRPGDLDALLQRLKDLAKLDERIAHVEADKALLNFIGDERVLDLFDAIDKWYA